MGDDSIVTVVLLTIRGSDVKVGTSGMLGTLILYLSITKIKR